MLLSLVLDCDCSRFQRQLEAPSKLQQQVDVALQQRCNDGAVSKFEQCLGFEQLQADMQMQLAEDVLLNSNNGKS
ncbi:hypothetical protein KC19_VG253500 [Ceratodon purpureus]|uniref:Uncharacterized protein n=1 Tax=Ceratodon purpureus TaxID=3225 RepID=A0A8T0HTM3_CERPU|nr:hypothetical protein KC19_VG253500 [Ceratodon purpureus]